VFYLNVHVPQNNIACKSIEYSLFVEKTSTMNI